SIASTGLSQLTVLREKRSAEGVDGKASMQDSSSASSAARLFFFRLPVVGISLLCPPRSCAEAGCS
ncbi:hypothetical protein MGG_16643, partial [Pyricularia oryzae 70-15]